MPIEYSREPVIEWENEDLKVVVQWGNRHLQDKQGRTFAYGYSVVDSAQRWVRQKIKARLRASKAKIARLEQSLELERGELIRWEEREKRFLK